MTLSSQEVIIRWLTHDTHNKSIRNDSTEDNRLQGIIIRLGVIVTSRKCVFYQCELIYEKKYEILEKD
ncbi:unnamed protein product [Debaryomyces tyrocola]|nr:unnamed protein product [Debaryomyces tyrocola]